MKKLSLVLLLWLCACCLVFGQVSSAKRALFNEGLNTIGKRVPSGWTLHDGLYWKSYNANDIVGGKDWLALQLNGNIVEQAIVGCAFTTYNAQMSWVSESYDTLVADKWEFISDDDESVLLKKGDKVAYIRIDSDDDYSAFVIFMSLGTVLGGNSGTTWTAVSNSRFGNDNINAIAYGNGKFVAVGGNGKMATSTDGVTWTAVSNSRFGRTHIRAIAYGNNRFVAAGDETAAYSTDGVTWTAVVANPSDYLGDGMDAGSVQKPFFARASGIIYVGGKFVEVCFMGRMATTTDGITWTAIKRADTTFGVEDINAIAYGNSRFVAVGDNGRMATSTNGTTWTAVSDSKFGIYEYIYAVAYGNSRFVVGGWGGKMATSANGTTWTTVDVSRVFGTSAIRAIAYGNGKFVAVGAGGKIATSTDGTNWTAAADSKFGTSDIYTIIYANGKFVAGGAGGKMAYLPD